MSTVSNSQSAVQVNGAPLTTTVSAANSPLLTNEIDNRIVKIRPMATPIDQLSRCGDVRAVGSMKVNYYSADVKDVSTELNGLPLKGDFVADATNTDAPGTLTLAVKKASIFSVSETVLVPDVVIDGAPLTLYVTKVDGSKIEGKVINKIASFEGAVLKQFAVNSRVVRMGRAAGELDVQTAQFETLPKRNENFCQIFKMQVEESTLHRLSNKEAQWGFSDQEEVAIIDMRQGMEKNFLFGIKCKLPQGAGGDEVYLTGGIWNQEGLPTSTYNPDTFSEKDLIALCRKVFTGGKGSARKILMGGSAFIEMLSNLPNQRVMVGTASMTRWGLEFREIKSNFGTLYVIHNEIFDQCGHEADAMVIDPNMLTKYVHIPFSTEKLDLRSSGTRNTDAVVITEASCLVLRNAACHLRIEAEATVARQPAPEQNDGDDEGDDM